MLVTGPNGSGKSSLLRLLAGFLPLFEGKISWHSKPIRDVTSHHANLHYIGHLDALKPELTVAETIGYWQALRGDNGTQNILHAFGLESLHSTPVKHLSAGQKRRLTLSRLMMGDAPLWLLDEPTTALDQTGQKLLTDLIAKHRAKGGMAIIAAHQHAEFSHAQYLALGEAA